MLHEMCLFEIGYVNSQTFCAILVSYLGYASLKVNN